MDVTPVSSGAAALPRAEPVHRPAAVAPAGEQATPRLPAQAALKFVLESADAEARFRFHHETNAVVVTVYHRESGEVIREFPSPRYLDVVAGLLDRGLVVDTEG
jgi:uncharacterized FlaG/YvyC family protein